MKAFLILAFAPFVYCAVTGDAVIDKHVAALQKAQSLTATFTVSKIGGTTEEQTLLLSRPNRFRWDSPGMLVVADGKHVTTYNKTAKTYTEADETDDSVKKALGADATWVWSAFADKDFAEGVVSVEKGSSKKVRNVAITDYTVTRKDKRVFTIQVEDETGVARGAKYTTDDKSDVIMLAKELKTGEEALDDSKFAFVAPEGATKAEAAVANAMGFAEVKGILDQNCAGCHGGSRPKAGVDLSSYAGVMGSQVVIPGDADNSRLIKIIKRGKMPPAGPLAADKIDMLAKWIAAGAKQ